jgi:glyoxylase-like metal-dependent hydrolase (beta-lactamase superfamily II)
MPDFKVAIVPVTVFQQNCSLIWQPGTMRAAVVDPGGEPAKIHGAIVRLGLKVELILLTHGHLDHVGGAKALKGILDAERSAEGLAPVPIVGPDIADAFLLEGVEEAQKAYNMAGMRNVTPDRYLVEGDTVSLGELNFEVFHVPGHTPGHIVFVEREARFAFVGDVLFKESVGRTDASYGNGNLLLAGIRTKLLPLGDDITFIPGHGPASTIGSERESNPFLRL